MSYTTLADPHHGGDETAFASGKVFVKFCSMGFVASRKWQEVYVTILDGLVRVYDSEGSCLLNPLEYVFQITLEKFYRASEVKKKNYSADKMQINEFYCFYIEIDNGIFAPTRIIKIGSPDPFVIERVVKSIDMNSTVV